LLVDIKVLGLRWYGHIQIHNERIPPPDSDSQNGTRKRWIDEVEDLKRTETRN
jgi:hypothetical protein